MRHHADLEQRIDALWVRAAGGADAALLAEIEDTLSEGYALALADEGRIRQLDRRLDALSETMDAVDAGDIRRIATERRQLGARVRRLRGRLAEMHEVFHAARRRSRSA